MRWWKTTTFWLCWSRDSIQKHLTGKEPSGIWPERDRPNSRPRTLWIRARCTEKTNFFASHYVGYFNVNSFKNQTVGVLKKMDLLLWFPIRLKDPRLKIFSDWRVYLLKAHLFNIKHLLKSYGFPPSASHWCDYRSSEHPVLVFGTVKNMVAVGFCVHSTL